MAKGTSTNGTSTTLSNTLAATIRLPPEMPPADDYHGHTHHTDECGLISNERCIPEDGLHHSGPKKHQSSGPK